MTKGFGIRRPTLQQHADHFRDHVAGTAHDHRVADVHILAAYLVFVVQRGIADRGTADEHRLQLGDRSELAGAPDLHLDVAHDGELLFRRKFVRHRPARFARDKAKFCLQRKIIDLVHHTVDVEWQCVALGRDARWNSTSPCAPCTTMRSRLTGNVHASN